MGSTRPLVVGCVLVVTGLAAAQPRPNERQLKAAGDLVKKAIAKSQTGDHALAIEYYQQAYELIPTPILLSNIGAEYQQANKPEDALKYFCKYLAADPTGANVGYVTAQAKTLQLQLGNASVDDKSVCAKPAATPVGSGTEPAGSGSPVAPGPVASSTVTGTVGLEHVDVDAAAPTPRPILMYAGIGVAGAGALAFGLGVYYGFHGKSISDYITTYTTDPKTAGMRWPADIQALQADGTSANTKQVAFMVGGGVALVAGAAMIYLGRPKPTEQISVSPTAGPGSVGVTVTGGF